MSENIHKHSFPFKQLQLFLLSSSKWVFYGNALSCRCRSFRIPHGWVYDFERFLPKNKQTPEEERHLKRDVMWVEKKGLWKQKPLKIMQSCGRSFFFFMSCLNCYVYFFGTRWFRSTFLYTVEETL